MRKRSQRPEGYTRPTSRLMSLGLFLTPQMVSGICNNLSHAHGSDCEEALGREPAARRTHDRDRGRPDRFHRQPRWTPGLPATLPYSTIPARRWPRRFSMCIFMGLPATT